MTEPDEKTQQMRFDVKLGYLILGILAVIVLGTVSYGIYISRIHRSVSVISFDQIGNLRLDDPVNFKGVGIGKIVTIQLRQKNVLVFAQTHKTLTLHRGYTIDNKDVGLMGDRALCIEDGDPLGPIVAPTDTLTGIFHPGVSEAVGQVWKLRGVIDSFSAISLKLLHGCAGKPSFVRRINAIISGTDSAGNKLLETVSAVSTGLSPKLDSLNAFINSVSKFARSAADNTPCMAADAQRLIGALEKSMGKADSLAVQASALVKALDTVALSERNKNQIIGFKEKIDILHQAILRLSDHLVQLKVSL